jgi:hypothetical protein
MGGDAEGFRQSATGPGVRLARSRRWTESDSEPLGANEEVQPQTDHRDGSEQLEYVELEERGHAGERRRD